MAGFNNGTMYADNVDFTGSATPAPQVTTNGQLLIGSTVAPNIRVGTLTSTGGTITVTPGAGTINLDLAGGSLAVDSVAMQTGTSPVVPAGTGLLTFNGSTAAAGTNPVRTNGTGANTMALQVQFSQAIAATNATNVGLAAFNNAQFTVDANGFVSLTGGGEAIDSIGVQAGTNPISPTAGGLVTINGSVVAAGSTPIQTNGTGANTMAVEVQTSQAVGGSDPTKIGLAAFSSTDFTVDANGFVELTGASGFDWNFVGVNTAGAQNNGYVVNGGTITISLPTVAAQGSIFRVALQGGTSWSITQGVGQTVQFGTLTTTNGVAGSLASTASGDGVEILCTVANVTFLVLSSVGNITVT